MTPTAPFVAALASLRIPRPTSILRLEVPQMGGGIGQRRDCPVGPLEERGYGMKVVRRVAIALGSLLAVALAGGAHWRG
jgi:hypothetical protein